MSRSRNIKPGFFKNEVLVGLPFDVRLLFIGLWTLADREGRLEDRPIRIKMELFPADSVDVAAGLDALAMAGFIVRYWADESQYIQILAFNKHQNPHAKEAPSKIPPPPVKSTGCEKPGASTMQAPEIPERAGLIPDFLIPDSGYLIPEKSVPATPVAPAPKAPKSAKGSRKPATFPIPDDFAISERVRKWAAAKGHHSLETHLEHFVGKCRAKGYVYAEWDEAFMGAVRDNWAEVGAVPNARAGPSQQLGKTAQAISTLEDMKRELAQNRTADGVPKVALLGPGEDAGR